MAFDNQTQVLTNHGFKYIKDIDYNDKLYVLDKYSLKSYFKLYPYKKQMFKRFSGFKPFSKMDYYQNQNLDFMVSEDHYINYQSEKTGHWFLRQSQYLQSNGRFLGKGWKNKGQNKILNGFTGKDEFFCEYFLAMFIIFGRVIFPNINCNYDFPIKFDFNISDNEHHYLLMNNELNLRNKIKGNGLLLKHDLKNRDVYYIYGNERIWKQLWNKVDIFYILSELYSSSLRSIVFYLCDQFYSCYRKETKTSTILTNKYDSEEIDKIFNYIEIISWMAGYQVQRNDDKIKIILEPKDHKRIVEYKTTVEYDGEVFAAQFEDMITIKRGGRITWISSI